MDPTYRINQMLYGGDSGYNPPVPEPEPEPVPPPPVPIAPYVHDPYDHFARDRNRQFTDAKYDRQLRSQRGDQQESRWKLEDAHQQLIDEQRARDRARDLAAFEAIEARMMGALTSKAPRRSSVTYAEAEYQQTLLDKNERAFLEKRAMLLERDAEASIGRSSGIVQTNRDAERSHHELVAKELAAERKWQADLEAGQMMESKARAARNAVAAKEKADATTQDLEDLKRIRARRRFQTAQWRAAKGRPGAPAQSAPALATSPFDSHFK